MRSKRLRKPTTERRTVQNPARRAVADVVAELREWHDTGRPPRTEQRIISENPPPAHGDDFDESGR